MTRRTPLIALLLVAATACAAGPDTSDPYGTWEFTYPDVYPWDGRTVELRTLRDIGNGPRVWWPTTGDENRVNSDDFLFSGDIDGVAQWFISPRGDREGGQIEIVLGEMPTATLYNLAVNVVKLEDE